MERMRGETAELQRLDQIPQGMTEEEADRFWETHSLGAALLDQMEPFADDFPLPPREGKQLPEFAEPGAASQLSSIAKIAIGGMVVAGVLAMSYLVCRTVLNGVDGRAIVRASRA